MECVGLDEKRQGYMEGNDLHIEREQVGFFYLLGCHFLLLYLRTLCISRDPKTAAGHVRVKIEIPKTQLLSTLQIFRLSSHTRVSSDPFLSRLSEAGAREPPGISVFFFLSLSRRSFKSPLHGNRHRRERHDAVVPTIRKQVHAQIDASVSARGAPDASGTARHPGHAHVRHHRLVALGGRQRGAGALVDADAVRPRDVEVVLGVDDVEAEGVLLGGGRRHERVDAGQRRPAVDDAGAQPVLQARVAAQRGEDGDDAEDAVGLEERGERGEGGDEDDGGEAGRFGGGRRGDVAAGQQAGDAGRVGEVQAHGAGDGGAERLPDDGDARGRDADGVQGVVDQGDAVGDQAGFGGLARRAPEAAVVDGEEVRVGEGGQGAVGLGAPALGDVTGVAVDWWVGVGQMVSLWEVG